MNSLISESDESESYSSSDSDNDYDGDGHGTKEHTKLEEEPPYDQKQVKKDDNHVGTVEISL